MSALERLFHEADESYQFWFLASTLSSTEGEAHLPEPYPAKPGRAKRDLVSRIRELEPTERVVAAD